MISFEYLDILKRKTMEKVVIEEIRVEKRKDKEDKQVKRIVELECATECATWKTVEKGARAQFTIAWTLAVVTEMGDYFHHDFQTCLQIVPHKYMGMNLGCTTWAHQQSKMRARVKQQSGRHWTTRLLPSNDWRINNKVVIMEKKVTIVKRKVGVEQ